MKIFKYPLIVVPYQEFFMHKDAKILHVGAQGEKICLWAEVFESSIRNNDTVLRKFYVVGTGHDVPELARTYLGTSFIGPYVWHLYEGI